MKHAIGVSLVALLALAACQKKTETTAAASAAAQPAAATAPAAPAGPLTPPPRKPGLWAQTVSMAQMTQTTKICLDADTDKKVAWWGSQAAKSTCQEQSITQHLGGGWDFHSVCKSDAGTTVSSGTASGDFNSRYRVDVTSTTTGAPMPQANGEHKIAIDASWQGPCPAGMKAGDMEMPGGMKINMNDAMAGKGPGAPGHAPNAAEIAQMRAQAKAMAAAMKDAK